ncbi:MAG: SAM-dependent methyltransferase, partial [Candidatus Omnitrophota bacterium]
DPGNSLINHCIKDKIPFTVIPGPTALISSPIISGLRTDKFIFMGFLPIKSGPRKKIIKTLIKEPHTVIFYESCHRLIKFLEELKEILPDRKVVLVKELTKKFEEIFRGIAEEHLLYFQQNKPRGEFVVLVAGNKEKNQWI